MQQYLEQQFTSTVSTTATAPKRPSQRQRTLRRASTGLGLSLALALIMTAPSTAIPIEDIPNPRQENGGWVTDMADMLSPSEEAELTQLISELEATEGHEIAVVTVPDTKPATTPKAFTTELFNSWGIGKAGEDNGVLFVVSKGDRRTEIEVGYGLEETLPDAQVGEILRSRVTPEFKQGNFNTGILSGTEALVTVLEGDTLVPLAAPSKTTNTNSNTPPIGADGIFSILMLLGMGALSVWSTSKAKSMNGSRGSHYHSSHNYYGSHNHYGGGSSYGGGSDFGGGSSGGGGGGDSW